MKTLHAALNHSVALFRWDGVLYDLRLAWPDGRGGDPELCFLTAQREYRLIRENEGLLRPVDPQQPLEPTPFGGWCFRVVFVTQEELRERTIPDHQGGPCYCGQIRMPHPAAYCRRIDPLGVARVQRALADGIVALNRAPTGADAPANEDTGAA